MSDEQFSFDLQPPKRTLPHLWTPDDIFRRCNEEVIRDFAEDNRVERKRVEVSQRDLAEYYSMWANTQPHGGIVFIGVSNDGAILGCKHIETAHLNDLDATGRLCSDARTEFKRVPVTNASGEDDFVIVLRVYYRHDRLVETMKGMPSYERERTSVALVKPRREKSGLIVVKSILNWRKLTSHIRTISISI